jgi:hypothetical protein
MTGTLSHTQSQLVTRADLLTIPPPPATPTWKPIAHADLIQALDRQLLVRGITIQKEQFALQRQGARLFAVLDLAYEETEEFCAALGIRTANDRSMALEIAVGVKVFVCDNLTFSGDLIALRRKHTTGFDLNADLSRAIDRYQHYLGTLKGQVERLKCTAVSEVEAKGLIFDVFAKDILPIRLFQTVSYYYFWQEGDGSFVRGTLWALHNACTRAVKLLAPAPAFSATTKLGKVFGLATESRDVQPQDSE